MPPASCVQVISAVQKARMVATACPHFPDVVQIVDIVVNGRQQRSVQQAEKEPAQLEQLER